MKQKIKNILQNSFYQLIAVYTILVLLISLNLYWKYALQFQIFALIIAILGIFIINKKTDITLSPFKNKYLHYTLFILAIILIILFRIFPYINQPLLSQNPSDLIIPLGYDAGIYKYAIESFSQNHFQIDNWLKGAITPGFLYLTYPLMQIFSSQTILTYIFILFNLILGLAIYLTTKEYFNKQTGLIAFLIYAVSAIQFQTFTYLYYKNIIALSLMLFAIYFHKKQKTIPFIILGALIGAMHRPTFYIFGLSYILFTIYNYKDLKTNIFKGLSILALTLIFYIGFFKQAILPLINPLLQSFTQPGESAGTFINFFTYQFSILAYLPFAILGFFYLAKKKQFNMIFFWTLINASIVYFQFFFFNRFIIHLDIALIILASVGFSIIIQNKKKLGTIILILMLFSAGFVTFTQSINTHPLITESELQAIQYLSTTEQESFVMSTSSIYSPWILGYSERKTIAPGLFDYNQHNEAEWIEFWTTTDINEVQDFMNKYNKPLYVFIGQKQTDNLEQFPECFIIIHQQDNNKIYKYIC